MAGYDIILGPNFDLPEFPRHGKGIAKIAQAVRVRLLTFLGEWVLDRTKGLPWFQWILDNFDNPQAAGGVVRAEIESTPGVLRVEDFTAVLNEDEGRFIVSGTVFVEGAESFGISVVIDEEDDAGNTQPTVIITGGTGALL